MLCIKCKREIPDGSKFCNHCGKKQSAAKAKYHKRASGTGTIVKDSRNIRPWIAYSPADRYGENRRYIGAYGTRAEAQTVLDDFVRNGRRDYSSTTFAQIYDMWSEQHFRRISQKGIALYRSMWKWFTPLYNIRIAELRTADFQNVIDRAQSASAANTLIALCSMICRYALENDIIDKNYADFLKPPKFEKKEKKAFSREDIAKLWAHSDNPKVQAVLIMIYTGFRIGEVTSIKLSDIHLDEGYIIGGEKTKAGKNRVVPLPPNIPEIRSFIEQQISRIHGDTLYNFSECNLRRNWFYPALEAAGITEKYTPHSTRHTFASLSAAAGINPENLQKIIGHANFSTTADIYIHQNIDDLKAEMSKITK